MPTIKSLFLLDPEVVFLNHGSFGATPAPVFETYQRWQRELERQPVHFITSVLNEELCKSRAVLAAYLGTPPEDLLFLPNATHGVNQVARSFRFEPGDEILATNHEYGACENVWDYICRKTGAVYIRQPMPLPASSHEAWVDRFWRGVTSRTRVIYLSHITSPTAQRFPVEEVCRRARSAGIMTLIDGAHAPGQIALDLENLGADYYTGNCHKWMMSPKGAAFLYARRESQDRVEPLVVGWGWSEVPEFSTSSRFLNLNQWLGTDDFSSYLAVADAIRFQEEHFWDLVRVECSLLLSETLARIEGLTGMASLVAPEDRGVLQMGIAELPRTADRKKLKQALLEEYGVEVPVIEWGGRLFVRVSIQAYNSHSDSDALVKALHELLKVSG